MSVWSKIVGFFSGIGSSISGVGSIAGAVQEVAKDAGKAMDMADRKESRNEGAQAQQNVDLTAREKAAEDALKAANNASPAATDGKLRDGRF